MKTANEILLEVKCLIISARQEVDDEQAHIVLSRIYDALVKMQKEIDAEPSSQTHLNY